MIFVGLGILPSANKHEEMNQIGGPGPNAYNRVGSFIGPMSASFQINPPDALGKGDPGPQRYMADVNHPQGIRC
jgi:NAD(P)H dehydrogenase (quinone)